MGMLLYLYRMQKTLRGTPQRDATAHHVDWKRNDISRSFGLGFVLATACSNSFCESPFPITNHTSRLNVGSSIAAVNFFEISDGVGFPLAQQHNTL